MVMVMVMVVGSAAHAENNAGADVGCSGGG